MLRISLFNHQTRTPVVKNEVLIALKTMYKNEKVRSQFEKVEFMNHIKNIIDVQSYDEFLAKITDKNFRLAERTDDISNVTGKMEDQEPIKMMPSELLLIHKFKSAEKYSRRFEFYNSYEVKEYRKRLEEREKVVVTREKELDSRENEAQTLYIQIERTMATSEQIKIE